jgi:Leucine-rich repeat (LRR) protein
MAQQIIDTWVNEGDTDIVLSLKRLDLSELPPLPKNVIKLDCSENKLTSLPELPLVMELNCSDNKLKTLPDLPRVRVLNCILNKLTTLPELPSIRELHCSYNNLTTLPELPSVTELHCDDNKITSLPDLPLITKISCEHNPLPSIDIVRKIILSKQIVNKDVFKKLCLQNTIVPEQTYGINEVNFQAWIDRQSEQYKDIALVIKKNTRHISFTEFYNTIKSMIADLQIISKQYDQVYLVIGHMRKSSFWVAMLMYKFLVEIHKEDLITQIIKDFMVPLNVDKNILYVYCDDASYSGMQLDQTFHMIDSDCYHDIFLLCPYISLTAKKTLSDFKKLVLSSSIQTFYSLKHCIQSDPNISDKNKLLDILGKLQLNTDGHMIYFDHKIADMVSIFQNIYALGTDLGKKTEAPITIIKNCELAYGNVDPNSLVSPEYLTAEDMRQADLQEIVGINNMCPRPFYKEMILTVDGEKYTL